MTSRSSGENQRSGYTYTYTYTYSSIHTTSHTCITYCVSALAHLTRLDKISKPIPTSVLVVNLHMQPKRMNPMHMNAGARW